MLLVEIFLIIWCPTPFTMRKNNKQNKKYFYIFFNYYILLKTIKKDIEINCTDLTNNGKFHYQLNEILSLAILIRVYIIIRVILRSTYWNSNRASRV